MNFPRCLKGRRLSSRRFGIAVLYMLTLPLFGCSPMLRWQEGGQAQSASSSVTSSCQRCGRRRTFVTVKRGETLYSIAFRHDLDFHRVAAWNHIGSSYKIYPGERIRLRPPPEHVTRKSRAHNHSPPKTRVARVDNTQQNGPIPLDSVPPPGFPRFNIHDWHWPIRGEIVQRFNPGVGSKGIDIAGRLDQSVRAAAPGKVVYSGNALKGYGQLIIVKHDARYLSAYAYNSKILVKQGQWVRTGQVIATVGEGPKHRAELHFEIREMGKPVDPLRFLPIPKRSQRDMTAGH